MSDFGAPVAQNIDPLQGLQTLSSLLGLKQKELDIQRTQAGVAEAQATAQQQQQTAQQRAALGQFWKNFNPQPYIGADGTISMDKVLEDQGLRQAAGDLYPSVLSTLTTVKGQQIKNQQSLVDLNDSARKQLQEMLGGLRTDPDVTKDNTAGRQKVQTAIQEFGSTSPEAARVAAIYGGALPHIPPGRLSQALSNMQLQAMSASSQASAQSPQYLGTGASAVNVNPQAPGGNLSGSPSVRMSIPPGMHTFTDQAGNTWAFNPQDPGHATLVGHGPAGNSGGASSASGSAANRAGARGAQASSAAPSASNATPSSTSGPPVLPVGGQQNANTMAHTDAQTYSAVRTAANEAPQTKNILRNIEILSGETKTGVGSKDVADAEAALGQYIPGFSSLQDSAAKRQLLGKYTEQLAMRVTEANGYGTDQARNLVGQAIPNPNNMGPKAIQQAARFIMAQTELSQARGAVANRYVQEHGGSSQGLQAVDSAFMQHVDPRMFDYIGLSSKERGAWLKKTFPDKAAAMDFLRNMSVVSHYGGFDYQ